MATRTSSSILDPAILAPAVSQAFRKLDPRLLVLVSMIMNLC